MANLRRTWTRTGPIVAGKRFLLPSHSLSLAFSPLPHLSPPISLFSPIFSLKLSPSLSLLSHFPSLSPHSHFLSLSLSSLTFSLSRLAPVACSNRPSSRRGPKLFEYLVSNIQSYGRPGETQLRVTTVKGDGNWFLA